MRLRFSGGRMVNAILTITATLAFALPGANAQQPSGDANGITLTGGHAPWLNRSTPVDGCAGLSPSISPITSDGSQAASQDMGLSGSGGFAVGGERFASVQPGYIDSALIRTQIRTRFDAAYDNNRPDRAEFFYGKCGCFRTAGIDPRAPGPALVESSVDYQEISTYVEYAFSPRFSAFIEAPYRFINPQQNDNANGFGDINAGFKYALINDESRVLTLQLRTYAPTGDPGSGLGTNHVSIEPALLYFQPLSERFFLEAELRDWIPIGGTDFSGNIVRYGVGISYFAYNGPSFRIAPIGEIVGWTVLNGKELAVATVAPTAVTNTQNASGDTIINAKVGVRFGFGELGDRGFLSRSDFYAGYGRALTGDVWYKDMFRLEYRMKF
jgi:hypothetical protein